MSLTAEINAIATDPEIAPLLQPTYMKKELRTEHETEIAAIERQLNDPVERKKLHNPGRLAQDVQRRKKNLVAQTPPPLTPSQRDKVARLNRLAIEDGREGMLSQEELRSRPTGAVDRQTAWQQGKKRAVILFKRTQLLLHPDSDARDLCNFEQFRPSRPGSRDLYVDSARPRIAALSAEAKANYDQIDWSSPECQAELQRLVDEGKIRINTNAREADRRAPKNTQGSDCKFCNRMFSGPSHKQNKERHEKACSKRGDLVGAAGAA